MASGVLHIRYGSENIGSKVSGAVKELSGICSSLDRIRDKIVDLPERSRSGNNLSKASSFLRKKQQEMERRQDALEVLKSRSEAFMSRVETTEKRLSSDIKHSYKEFHKETGIGKTMTALFLEKLEDWWNGSLARKVVSWLFSSALAGAKAVGEAVIGIGKAIVNLYNESKYLIKAVLSVVGCLAAAAAAVVAIVAVPGAGFVAGIIALAKVGVAINSIVGAVKDVKTAALYYSGDKEAAHELNAKSNAEFFSGGNQNVATAYNWISGICSFVTIGADLHALGSSAWTSAKNMSKGTSFGTRAKEFGKVFKTNYSKNWNNGMESFKKFNNFRKENGVLKIFTSPITANGQPTAALDAFGGISRGCEFVNLGYDSIDMISKPSWDGFGNILNFFVGGARETSLSEASGS